MEENQLAIKKDLSHVDIRNLIYTIRGKQVMLDSDVAMLYHYETKNVNKAVKRNIDRFPEDFCFQLTKDEMNHKPPVITGGLLYPYKGMLPANELKLN